MFGFLSPPPRFPPSLSGAFLGALPLFQTKKNVLVAFGVYGMVRVSAAQASPCFPVSVRLRQAKAFESWSGRLTLATAASKNSHLFYRFSSFFTSSWRENKSDNDTQHMLVTFSSFSSSKKETRRPADEKKSSTMATRKRGWFLDRDGREGEKSSDATLLLTWGIQIHQFLFYFWRPATGQFNVLNRKSNIVTNILKAIKRTKSRSTTSRPHA